RIESRIASVSEANLHAGAAASARHRAKFAEPTWMKNKRCEQEGPVTAKSRSREDNGEAKSNTKASRNATALKVMMTAFQAPEKSECCMDGVSGDFESPGKITWTGQKPPVPTTVSQTGRSSESPDCLAK